MEEAGKDQNRNSGKEDRDKRRDEDPELIRTTNRTTSGSRNTSRTVSWTIAARLSWEMRVCVLRLTAVERVPHRSDFQERVPTLHPRGCRCHGVGEHRTIHAGFCETKESYCMRWCDVRSSLADAKDAALCVRISFFRLGDVDLQLFVQLLHESLRW